MRDRTSEGCAHSFRAQHTQRQNTYPLEGEAEIRRLLDPVLVRFLEGLGSGAEGHVPRRPHREAVLVDVVHLDHLRRRPHAVPVQAEARDRPRHVDDVGDRVRAMDPRRLAVDEEQVLVPRARGERPRRRFVFVVFAFFTVVVVSSVHAAAREDGLRPRILGPLESEQHEVLDGIQQRQRLAVERPRAHVPAVPVVLVDLGSAGPPRRTAPSSSGRAALPKDAPPDERGRYDGHESRQHAPRLLALGEVRAPPGGGSNEPALSSSATASSLPVFNVLHDDGVFEPLQRPEASNELDLLLDAVRRSLAIAIALEERDRPAVVVVVRQVGPVGCRAVPHGGIRRRRRRQEQSGPLVDDSSSSLGNADAG